MKKKLFLLLGVISSGLLLTSCEDESDAGKAVNITIQNATNISGDIFAINVTEGQTLQLKAFIMPQSAADQSVTYKIEGTPTGAIEITQEGLIKALATTPATGAIPVPLASDTIIATVNDGSGTFVRYPVRVISATVLVTSITIQTAGQAPTIEKGKTFNLAQYVTINPATASNRTVSYSSDNEAVATVDQNGIITALGQTGQSAKITVTANDRSKLTASSFVTIAAEAPMYVVYPIPDKSLSSNLEVQEGSLEALLDDNNATFWVPKMTQRPNYAPECFLNIDLGAVIKFGQLGYRHRLLNYAHLQCHTFKIEARKTEADAWTDLGDFVTVPLQVDKYQLFAVTPTDARYIRIKFIKGHLRDGKTDWNYSEAGTVCVGDIQVLVYNR